MLSVEDPSACPTRAETLNKRLLHTILKPFVLKSILKPNNKRALEIEPKAINDGELSITINSILLYK
jgi:hypothetical protein